jgi:hypothetical protein
MNSPASDKVHGPHGEWPLDKHLMYLVGLADALGDVTLNAALMHEICRAYSYYRWNAERMGHSIERLEDTIKKLKEKKK